MDFRDIIQAVQLLLNLLLIPLVKYMFSIEHRLTSIETTLKHLPKRKED